MAENAALDEIQWRAPQILQHVGGLNINTIHYYFNHSPFSIPTSNNSSLLTQAQFNQSLQYLAFNRDALEARLRTMRGIEFVVVYPPSPLPPPNQILPNYYILRKQLRRGPDDTVPMGTYFCVGENLYMAPVVEKVIGSRILNVARALREVEEIVRGAREKEQGGAKVQVRDREKEVNEGMLRGSLERTLRWTEEYLDGEKKDVSQSQTQSQGTQGTASTSVGTSFAQSQSTTTSLTGEKVKSVVVGKEKKEDKITTPVSAGGTNKKRRKSKVPGNGLVTPTTETPGASGQGAGVFGR